MESDKPEGGRSEVAAAPELSAGLGGVLVYRSGGIRAGMCGQTVGADGSGEFALLIKGTPDAADQYARTFLRELETRVRVEEAIFVPFGEEYGYFGNPIRTVDA